MATEFTIPPLSARIKARWVKALRSGKYKQTTGTLKEIEVGNGVSFCCLGVLRECLTTKEREAADVEMDNNSLLVCTGRNTAGNPYYAVVPEHIQDRLAGKNDTKGWSFKKIASYIERSKTI